MKYTLNTQSDIQLLSEYKINPNEGILKELLNRYFALFKKLSLNHLQKFPNTTLEDNLQNSRVAAIQAIERYDFNLGVKFSTFLYNTVYYYLLSCNDSESFISCSSNLREIRSYFAGKYDLDLKKKQSFEKKHNLNTKEDIQSFQIAHQMLSSDAVQVVEILPEKSYNLEDNLLSNIHFNTILDRFNEEDKQIVCLLIEGYNISNIARIFSEEKKQKYSDKQIKKRLDNIKKQFYV